MTGSRVSRYVLIFFLLSIAGTYIWFTRSRLAELDRKLEQAEERAEKVRSKMLEYARELDRAVHRAREASSHAVEAEHRAAQEAAAKLEALAREEEARAEAEKAVTKEQQTAAELEEIRKRRRRELDRMQEALNRVAPTRRTPAGMVTELSNDSFRFDFDKATLRPENRELLSRIAGILLASEGYRLFVYGHTDDVGSDEYNEGLSLRRAQSVRDYLVQAGVPKEIILTKGFGKKSPREKDVTREAREKNRRVEIGIVDTIIEYGEVVKEL
ncbi:MAG: OmpA family protein [Bryobacteraceae bacterium]